MSSAATLDNHKADNPYVGPRPFGSNDELYGRDREKQDLFDLMLAERIVLLYSPSGAGKTSLVNATLIPKLVKEAGFRVLPTIRVKLEPQLAAEQDIEITKDTNRHCVSTILSLEARKSQLPEEEQWPLSELVKLDLDTYLKQRPRREGEAQIDVLVFDQFEEILTSDPFRLEDKKAFFNQVGDALADRKRWAIFIVREDYVAPLYPYFQLIPTRLRTTFRLDWLNEKAAREAIQRPAENEKFGVTFDPKAATQLINDLRKAPVQGAVDQSEEQRSPYDLYSPYVEPLQLQVVCRWLWQTLPKGTKRITIGHLKAIGDVNHALGNYYAATVNEVAEATGVSERKIRDWFEQELITSQGVRGQVLKGSERDLPEPVTSDLERERLIRFEQQRNAIWIELVHDRMIEPIKVNNASWRDEHLTLMQRQAILWDSEKRPSGLLMRGAELAEAERWAATHEDELTRIEQDFLDVSRDAERAGNRRRRFYAGAFVLIASALLLVGVFAFLTVQAGYAVKQANATAVAQNTALSKQNATVVAQSTVVSERNATVVAQSTVVSEQKEIATAHQLAAQALSYVDNQPDLALLLGVQSYNIIHNITDTLAARGSLLAALERNPQLITFLHGNKDSVSSVAFSPDGRTLASTSDNGTIILWNVAITSSVEVTSSIRLTLTGHMGTVWSVAFSRDSKMLASAGSDKKIILWNIGVSPPMSQTLPGHTDVVRSVAFSPNGKTLASGSTDKSILLWDLSARSPVSTTLPPGHVGDVSSVIFSPNGSMLASGGYDKKVILWDVATRRQLGQPLTGHTNYVISVAFSPDGKMLASGSTDKTIRLWDVATHKQRGQPLTGHSASVFSVAFSPDGKTLASGAGRNDNTIILWNVGGKSPVSSTILTGHQDDVNGLAFSPDGKTLASGSRDRTIRLWAVATQVPLGRLLTGHRNDVSSVAFSPDGRFLASGSYTDHVILWNVIAQQPVSTPLTSYEDNVNSLAFSQDGRFLASGSERGTILKWDVTSQKPISTTVDNSNNRWRSVAFSPDSKMLASGTGLCGRQDKSGTCVEAAGEVYLWNLTTTTSSPNSIIFTGHKDIVNSLAFHPKMPLLASASDDDTIILWDITSQKPISTTLTGHRGDVNSVAFSPDGKFLASGSDDETIRLWDVATLSQHGGVPLHRHTDQVKSVAFSPDSKILASGSADKTIIFWDVNTQQPLGLPLAAHHGIVNSLAFSPDGNTLASGNADSTIILWNLRIEDWIERACSIANRNMTQEEWKQYLPSDMQYRKTCPNLP